MRNFNKQTMSLNLNCLTNRFFTTNFNLYNNNINYLRDFTAENPKLKLKITNHTDFIKLNKIGNLGYYDYTVESLMKIAQDNYNDLVNLITNLDPNFSYAIIFLVRNSITKTVVTLDRHILVNNTTPILPIIKRIYNRLDALSVRYHFEAFDSLIVRIRKIEFKVSDPKPGNNKKLPIISNKSSITLKNTKLSKWSFLPHTMHHPFYGELERKIDNVYTYLNKKVVIEVTVIEPGVYHTLKIMTRDTREDITAIEDLASEDGFIRYFEEANYCVQYNNNSEIINIEHEVNVDFIDTKGTDLKEFNKILTFDIESYIDDEMVIQEDGSEKLEIKNSIAYACGYFDGISTKTYYLSDYDFSSYNMLLACITDMMKYDKHIIYCHNFGRFDIHFVHKILHENFDVKEPLSKDINIIAIAVKSRDKNKLKKGEKKSRFNTVLFSDSLRILPAPLSQLAKSFKVETLKGHFPYKFVNKENINYKGTTPPYSCFIDNNNKDKMTIKEYNELYSNSWCLKEETIKYLNKDLISLHEVIMKMSHLVFDNWRVNLASVRTISALAFLIYRSNFLVDDSDKNVKALYPLAKLKGKVEECVRLAYYGGRNEVYKPTASNIYVYDYNSLYPTAMTKPMPVGKPLYSKLKDLSKIFGFVKANITMPDMYYPVLPCRVVVDGEEKLIFPTGKWTGWYFSEELKLAEKYGCVVEVVESYIFEKNDDCFKDYVHTFAEIKDNNTGAMREIAKLAMNSLYGRTGMKNTPDVIKYVTKEEGDRIHLTNEVIDCFHVTDNIEYIRYKKRPSEILCEQSNSNFEILDLKKNEENNGYVDNSTPIAAATASWARILMYPHIIGSVYTDTDSTFINKPLHQSYIGKGCGKFKAEYNGEIVSNAIFAAPKMYYLEFAALRSMHRKSESKKKGVGKSVEMNKEKYCALHAGYNVEIQDTRWKRSLEFNSVFPKDFKYIIKSNFDKREKIYSNTGVWIDTKAWVINNIFEITSSKRSVNMALVVYKDIQKGLIVMS